MSSPTGDHGTAQRQSAQKPRFAFVTLLTTDEYLPAALVVAHSLRLVHAQSSSLSDQDRQALASDYDLNDPNASLPHLGPWPAVPTAQKGAQSDVHLVAIVTPETLAIQSIRSLLAVYDRVIGVETLGIESVLAMQQAGQIEPKGKSRQVFAHDSASPLDVNQISLDNLALLDRPDLGTDRGAALTKLHAWRLTDYDKVLFLDADTLILQPLAHLFLTKHHFAASPDTGWPDIFNSGVMLLTPSHDTFDGLLQLAAERGSWDGADQGLINEHFGGEVGSGFEGRGGGWSRLPFTYNTTALGGYTYAPAFARYGDNVKVAHFIGADKPWRSSIRSRSNASLAVQGITNNKANLSARWWAVYDGFYPSQPPTPAFGDGSDSAAGSDIEVRITERGAEIVERPRPRMFQVPAFQAAWDSLAGQNASRGLTVEQLQKSFSAGSHMASGDDEGRYDSLPLHGRIDLIAPRFVRPQKETFSRPHGIETSQTTPTAPAGTQHSTASNNAPPESFPSQSWDATTSSPPHDSTPAGHQMRNPPDTYFTNAWDKPAAELSREEKERRRQFLNPNLRQGSNAEQLWGYIPPEAREIHTFSHLTDRPDEKLVRPVFPWEERQSSVGPTDNQSGGKTTRVFPGDPAFNTLSGSRAPSYHRTRSSDPSLGGGHAGGAHATRKWDDHAVYATSHGSPSASPPTERGFNTGNLVARYGNVWDAEGALGPPPANTRAPQQRSEESDRQQEARRQAYTYASSSGVGRRSRRGTKSSGGSIGGPTPGPGGSVLGGRPSSTYVPNVYDDYLPAPRATLRRSFDAAVGAASGLGEARASNVTPRSNLTSAMMARQASSATSDGASIDQPMYGREGSGVYDRTLSRLGGETALSGQHGGAGEVEASSSWNSHLTDLIRLGEQPGSAVDQAGSGSHRSRPSASGMSLNRAYRSRHHGGEEDDGDDETSSDESKDSTGSARSPYCGAPPLNLTAQHGSSQGGSEWESRSPPQGGHQSGVDAGSGPGAGTDRLTVPESYSSSQSGADEMLPREREGPGYLRKAQASSFVRSHITPRSPRHTHHPLLGSSTTGSGVTPSTTIPVGRHSLESTEDAQQGMVDPSGYLVEPSVQSANTVSPAPALTGRARIKPNKRPNHGPSAEYGYGEGWLG
ncbi:unnamed protein product [Sympodiomycopsis kandeliae]